MPEAGGGALGGPTSNPIIEQILRALFAGQSGAPAGLSGAPTMPPGGGTPFPGFRFGAETPTMPTAPQSPSGSPSPMGAGGFMPMGRGANPSWL
jgi:hypothetical protein